VKNHHLACCNQPDEIEIIPCENVHALREPEENAQDGTLFELALGGLGCRAYHEAVEKPKRIEVVGTPVDCVDMNGALLFVDALVRGTTPGIILAVNPEKVIRAQQDPALLRHMHEASLLIPDGIGVVIAARLLRNVALNRVPGAELMPAICAQGAGRGYRVFLFGADSSVNEAAVARLRRDYPGLVISGFHHGYVNDEEMPAVVQAIDRSRANVLFVALGSPRQELWMARYLPSLPHVRVCQGVGGTFDVLAGRVRRAPAMARRLHLEWLYRLAANPRRLLRQSALPSFAWQVISAHLRGKA